MKFSLQSKWRKLIKHKNEYKFEDDPTSNFYSILGSVYYNCTNEVIYRRGSVSKVSPVERKFNGNDFSTYL